MVPVVFHKTDIGGKECRHGEKHQNTVSNDGVRNNPKFQRRGKHGTRPDSNHVVFGNSADIPDKKCDRYSPAEGSRETLGKIGKSEELI